MLTADTAEDPETVAAPVEPYTPSERQFLDAIAASYPHPIQYMMTAEASKVIAEEWRLAVIAELAAAAKSLTLDIQFPADTDPAAKAAAVERLTQAASDYHEAMGGGPLVTTPQHGGGPDPASD